MASLPGFCVIFFHSSLLWDECFSCKRIHPFVLFSLDLCSSQSLINVTLKLCNPSQTFFIKPLPELLSTDDFPRVFSEPLGIFFLYATLKLLRFQILKFCNLVINCLAASRLYGSSSESPSGIAACKDMADSWQWSSYWRLPSEWNFFTKSRAFLDHFHWHL